MTRAHTAGTLDHYIGYRATLDLLKDWTGCDLGDVNVQQTELDDGEVFLVLRLNRRIGDSVRTVPRTQRKLTVDDFLFYRCTYHAAVGTSRLMDTITEITGCEQFSYNLADQRVLVPRKNSVQKRTVYHITMESGWLIGSVLNTSGDDNWMRVVFDEKEHCWFPRRVKDTGR